MCRGREKNAARNMSHIKRKPSQFRLIHVYMQRTLNNNYYFSLKTLRGGGTLLVNTMLHIINLGISGEWKAYSLCTSSAV